MVFYYVQLFIIVASVFWLFKIPPENTYYVILEVALFSTLYLKPIWKYINEKVCF